MIFFLFLNLNSTFSVEIGLFWSEIYSTVKLGDKERFDKEQIGVKDQF